MKSVAVVIPIYSASICEKDAFSLRSFQRHLSRYDVIFACPEKLDISAYLHFFPNACSMRFPEPCFQSVQTYSRMLKKDWFYSVFIDYEYILICQLDCLVFKDELLAWCDAGYSYIGPPWEDLNFIGGWKRNLFRLLPFRNLIFPAVGNGGFSLRNVAVHARLAQKHRWLAAIFFWLHEDLFWCGVVGKLEREYRIPGYAIAMRFAIEYEPERSVQRLDRKLPFGCHAWDRTAPSFWREQIRNR